MRILKPSWAHDRTIDYFELSPPPEETLLPTFKGRRDVLARTKRGLGGGARPTSDDATSRAEQRWVAIVEGGLIDLDTIPVLIRQPGEASSSRCDEVESYVVLGIDSGTTLRALIGGGRYEAAAIVRAIGRLSVRGRLQLF